ncbi:MULTISPECIES: hypothetical protein [unclassified Nostoc]|uniref:hypothetical protein n=1 Tax=unclassified Nostoc TaxID=2593658 RepID=UPI002ADCD366|nr:hypothetical protein [Nostoc sp. DedQUE02]
MRKNSSAATKREDSQLDEFATGGIGWATIAFAGLLLRLCQKDNPESGEAYASTP